MKAKTKLIATLMAMCLVITLGVFGILAVKTLNMSVGGNITFNADGVSFTIGQGKFYQSNKTTEYAGITTQTGKMQGFAMNTNTKLEDVEEEITSWTGLELALDSQGDAVLKFNIKNDMSDKQLYVMFTVSEGTNTNDNMRIICATSELIEPTDNKNITITFDILDDSINAGLAGFKIDINIGEPVQVNATTGVVEGANQNNTKYSNAKYNLNTTAKTASVTKSSDNVSGEVVIVDRVYVGTQEYAVTEIAASAFAYCDSITTVNIPNGVTKIAECAFQQSSISSATLPNTLTQICNSAFEECDYLTKINIPNGVTSIGSYAFYYCYNLQSLELPETILTIGEYAFPDCYALTYIKINKSTPPTISEHVFDGINCPIYVPGASVHLYKTATNWSTYASRIKAIPGTESDSGETPVLTPKTVTLDFSIVHYDDNYDGFYFRVDDGEWINMHNMTDYETYTCYQTISIKSSTAKESDKTITTPDLVTLSVYTHGMGGVCLANPENTYAVFDATMNAQYNTYTYLVIEITQDTLFDVGIPGGSN